MKKIYKRKSLRRLAAVICAALTAGTLGFSPVLHAHPILDAAGAGVNITGTTDMSINSSLENNVIKWVDFSIGMGEKVAFDTHNYLNYVTGSARSDILGTLTGGGSIYLVNPNGILIGDGATINVGNLYLSTKNLTDAQLADYSAATGALFKSDNAALGDVINMGKLNANSVTVEGKNITFKNVAEVTAATVNVTSDNAAHVGFSTGDKATTVNDAQYKNVTEPRLTGWTFNKTPDKYMLVRNGYELQNMQNSPNGKYMLAGNINANAISEFTPIGNFSSSFIGHFDGLNYMIENLHIKVSDGYNIIPAGLFGVNKGIIENLEVRGADIKNGGRGELTRIGAVAGLNYQNATIRNVRNTGNIDYSTAEKGVRAFGSIVGENRGIIEMAYNTGNLTGNSDKCNYASIGGIAGQNYGDIKYAFNTGKITDSGTGGSYPSSLGGIAGIINKHEDLTNNGTIENAYNSGDIATNRTSNTYLGGIAGDLVNGPSI